MKDILDNLGFSIYLDRSSVEVFVNDGQYAMTDQLFPAQPYTKLSIENLSNGELQIKDLQINLEEQLIEIKEQV